MKQNRYNSIKVIRVIGILGVFGVHFGQCLNFAGKMRKVTDFGAYAPLLFYIISGFLAMHSLDNDDKGVLHYWKKRAIRLLPTFYFAVLCWMLLSVLHIFEISQDAWRLGWLRYFGFLNCIIPSSEEWNNIGYMHVMWPMAMFYFLAPYIRKCTGRWYKSVIAMGVFYLFTVVQNRLLCGFFQPLPQIFFFTFGITIYYAIKEEKYLETAILFAGLCVTWLYMGNQGTYIYSFLFGIIVLGMIGLEERIPGGVVTSSVVIDKIDLYSYDIWLLHGLVFFTSSKITNVWLKIVYLIVGTIASSMCVHEIMDWIFKRGKQLH